MPGISAPILPQTLAACLKFIAKMIVTHAGDVNPYLVVMEDWFLRFDCLHLLNTCISGSDPTR